MEKKLNSILKNIKNNLEKEKYSATDLKYMSSLSEAILAKTPTSSRKILYIALASIFGLITWAAFANVDELARGQGKIVPSGQNQVVQSLEGGIVEQIFVREGDSVTKNQPLIKIDNKTFMSNFGETEKRLDELKAKYLRLKAEANGEDFEFNKDRDQNITEYINHEISLFTTNKEQLNEQLNQKKAEINSLEARVKNLKSSYDLTQKEINITKPLVERGIVSQVDFLQLQKRLTDTKVELDNSILEIPRAKAAINEINLAFKNKAKAEFNEVSAEISRLKETRIGLEDKVDRTLIKSPVNGVITKMNIHTISGIIKPGEDIFEIVPDEDTLIAEIKVKPSDVAFLRTGLKATVKITAYDFGVYGGLEGVVDQISADTQTNEKKPDDVYYLVRVKTDKNYLGDAKNPLKIKVGMIVSADIMTGKKTVLDYILKPILKVKQAALRER